MATARKCDRCGVFYEGVKCRLTVESRNPEFMDDYYDLCDECKLEFEEFMKGAKPKNLLDRISYLSKAQKHKILKECSQAANYALINDIRREKLDSKG